MTEHPPEVETAFRELRALQDRLRQNTIHAARLRQQRRELFRRLLEDYGIERAEVARVAGVTSMAVQFDVYGRTGRGASGDEGVAAASS
jgi:hypothetical protein